MLHSYTAKFLKASQQRNHVTGHLCALTSPDCSSSPLSPTHHALPPDGRWCRPPCSSHRVASARINTPISPKAKLSLLLKLYLPLSVPACRLLSACTLLWPSTRPTQPSLTPNSSTPASGWLWSGALQKKKKPASSARPYSARLGSVQPFSCTRPALHLCE